jgi:hypothetical protein
MLLALPAKAEEVVAALSQNRVSIDTNFDGSEILIFGAVRRESPVPEAPLHVIVTVAGPSDQIVVRRKARVLGIWVNTEQVVIDRAPSFYAVATSAPWEEVITETEDLRHRISIGRAIRSVGVRRHGRAELHRGADPPPGPGRPLPDAHRQVEVAEATLFRTSVAAAREPHRRRLHGALLPDPRPRGDRPPRDGDLRPEGRARAVPLHAGARAAADLRPLSIAIAIAAGWGASAVFRYLKS